MSDTLRQQLLGLGFKETARPRQDERRGGRPGGKGAGKGPGKGSAAERGGQAVKPAGERPRPAAGKGGHRDAHKAGKPASGRGQGRGEIDLAKAYAIRAQKEKDDRIAAEKEKQEQARLRREARARVGALVEGKVLNAQDAEIARHFEYGGKIKRIYVTEAQLKALNAGELGVLQLNGRYLLVEATVLAAAAEVFPESVALRVDPQAPAADDPYGDPKYQVPDDLVW